MGGIGIGNSIYLNLTTGGYDADAKSYFERMTTAPSKDFKDRINTYIIAQKDSGLWAKKAVIVLLQAETAQAATLNMKGNVYNATFVNSPTWAANDGLTADVGYVNTNFNPATDGGTLFTQNNARVCVYVKTNIESAAYDIGALTTSPRTYLALNSRTTLARSVFVVNFDATTNTSGGTSPSSVGIYSTSRALSNVAKVFRNGLEIGNNSNTSITPVSLNLSVGGGNINGTTSTLSGRKYGLYEMTSALTPAEELTNYNQLKTLLGYTP